MDSSFRMTRAREKPEDRGSEGLRFCEQRRRLSEQFLQAIRAVVHLQTQQSQAVIDGDPDFERFDLLLHDANQRKDHAKYALMSHVESHRC